MIPSPLSFLAALPEWAYVAIGLFAFGTVVVVVALLVGAREMRR